MKGYNLCVFEWDIIIFNDAMELMIKLGNINTLTESKKMKYAPPQPSDYNLLFPSCTHEAPLCPLHVTI